MLRTGMLAMHNNFKALSNAFNHCKQLNRSRQPTTSIFKNLIETVGDRLHGPFTPLGSTAQPIDKAICLLSCVQCTPLQ